MGCSELDQAISYERTVSPIEAYDRCYSPPSSGSVEFPTIALRFTGGAKLDPISPYVVITDVTDNILAICLTLMDSNSEYSIVGRMLSLVTFESFFTCY